MTKPIYRITSYFKQNHSGGPQRITKYVEAYTVADALSQVASVLGAADSVNAHRLAKLPRGKALYPP
jgi:hypothetical protein